MKHLDKLKSSGVLQTEDRGEAAKEPAKPDVFTPSAVRLPLQFA